MKHFYIILLLVVCNVFGQNIVTINGESFSLQEFENKYKKNLEIQGINKSLDYFIESQLIGQYARKKGMENNTFFHVKYSNQLLKLKDSLQYPPEVINPIINQQLERSKIERKAQYIFLSYNNAEERKQKIKELQNIKDEITSEKISFNDAVEKYSEYKNKPQYYAYFEFNSPAENTLFQTPINTISSLYEENNHLFLFHIIDERKALGELFLSQIVVNGADNLEKAKKIKTEIDEGLDFAKAVEKYSDDEESKKSNGILPSITNAVSENVYDVLVNLNVNQVSIPVLIGDKYHIFKVDNVYKPKKGDAKDRKYIKERLETSYYSNRLNNSIKQVVTEKLPFKLNQNAIDSTLLAVKNSDKKMLSEIKNKDLFSINKYVVPMHKICDSLSKSIDINPSYNNLVPFAKNIISNYLNDEIIKYYNGNFDQMPHVINYSKDVKNAIALEYFFDVIIKEELDNEKAQHEFYRKHKEKYILPEHANATIYNCESEKIANEIYNLLEKNTSKEEIKAKFQNSKNENNELNVFIISGKFSKNSKELPKEFELKKGIQKLKNDKKFIVVQVYSIDEARSKTFQEAKDDFLPDLKSKLVQKKIYEIKREAKIDINQEAINTLKKRYKL
ncbi:MAG: peptidylprolyl isomerase [Flavobacteriales bacterium]|nr:peptidylprolyl isomerase [Flavobacteriales bacterium]